MGWIRLLVLGVLAGCAWIAAAEARGGHWAGGVYVGVAPPVYLSPFPQPYYAPRHYYPPVPYHAAPYSRPAASEGCYAGAYVCPLEGPALVGMPCSCPTIQGPAWGRAR